VKQRIEGAWADVIVVVAKLLHHGKAEDVLVRRVNEDMDSNQTGKEFPLMLEHTMNIPSWRFILIALISNFDIGCAWALSIPEAVRDFLQGCLIEHLPETFGLAAAPAAHAVQHQNVGPSGPSVPD
jgi:hypothetical protein